MVFGPYFPVFAHFGLRGCVGYFEHEHAVVGCERTPAFGYYVGMGNVVFVRGFDKCVHAVVYVFLDGVVYRAFAVARPSSVVVNAQAAATVDKLDVEAHCVKLYVELRGFA